MSLRRMPRHRSTRRPPDLHSVRRDSRSVDVASSMPVPSCNGEGEITTKKCDTCGGSGRSSRPKPQGAHPEGVATDPSSSSGRRATTRRYREGGRPACIINVNEHDLFRRRGDLFCSVPFVSISRWCCVMPTISGKT